MRSISGMPSSELAGDAKRRVPIPIKKEERYGSVMGRTLYERDRPARL